MIRWHNIAAALLSGCTVFAGSLVASEIDLGDRVGKALAAEMSSAPLTVYSLEKSPASVKFADCRYVVVTVALAEHRSISVVDYKLSLAGQTLSCIAIARNDESFVVNPDIMFATGSDRIRMLFILDGAKLGAGKTLSGTLSAALPGRKKSVSIPVTDLGSGALTAAAQIPAGGKF